MTLAPDDPRHGTRHAYDKFKCRCTPCRTVNNVYRREWYRATHPDARPFEPAQPGPKRERDDRKWSGRIGAEYGCIVTFENDAGEPLTLHRVGWPETVLASLCDEALAIDETLRVVSYSSPPTIRTDVTGPPTQYGRHREATILGQIGRLEMLHPRLRGRSSWSEQKYREIDALAR